MFEKQISCYAHCKFCLMAARNFFRAPFESFKTPTMVLCVCCSILFVPFSILLTRQCIYNRNTCVRYKFVRYHLCGVLDK